MNTAHMSNKMAGVLGYGREAIRVKVKKCEGVLQPEYRKFSVDPQITSFEVLQSILAKAFDIRGEFTVCYRAFDDYGQETYLSLLSDWDLDAAFLSASEPCLCLQVDMKPFEESSEEWDVVGCMDMPRTQVPESKPQNRLPGLIMNQVERTLGIFQRALNMVDDQQPSLSDQPPRPPLTDAEFRKFLDPIGQVVQGRELRTVIYYGGIEPSLRKVVWKHILNVYPDGMSGKERMDYMKRKAYEYQTLRDKWKDMVQNGQVTGDLAYVTSMVRKDVLRTDRHHRFYAGSDDNQNIASLFNILTTYALNHPTVSYCQGMSDLASPLLVTMGDEAHAYICFCALMKRLHSNFLLDGVTMTLKFQHLAEGLLYYDPEFYAYLKSHQADDLLFCYRWLLLEMKREFAFDDALRMLEVLWSSLPPMPPQKELQLYEKQFCPSSPGEVAPAISPLLKAPRENAYTKVCALRRQSSSVSLHSLASSSARHGIRHRQNMSLDETLNHGDANEKSKVKPFASLDDASISMLGHDTQSKIQSEQSFDDISDPDSDTTTTINNQINTNNTLSHEEQDSVSTSNILISKMPAKRGYLQDLKEKFSGSQAKNLFSSLDKVSNQDIIKDDSQQASEKKQVRVVKNLNEFLNFASLNKNRLLPEKIVCNSSPKKDSTWQDKVAPNESSDKTLSENGSLPSVVSSEESGIHSATSDCDEKKITQEGERDVFCDSSSPDDSTEYFPMTTSMTRELRLELENLDRQVFGSRFARRSFTLDDSEDLESPCSESFRSVEVKVENDAAEKDLVLTRQDSVLLNSEGTSVIEVIDSSVEPNNKATPATLKLECSWNSATDENRKAENLTPNKECDKSIKLKDVSLKLNSGQRFSPGPGTGEEIFVWENPLQCPTTPDEQADLDYDDNNVDNNPFSAAISGGEIFENEGQGIKSVTPIRLLRTGVVMQDNDDGTASLGDDNSDSSDGWGDRGTGNRDAGPYQAPAEHTQSPWRENTAEKSNLDSLRQPNRVPGVAVPVSSMTNSCEEVTESASRTSGVQLPPPSEFGGGNPFLMFLCLTVLRQHRDIVMGNRMDYNEMAMHFDKMIRKHNVTRVLNQARQMFASYLRQQQSLNNNTDLNV